jgi:NAD(P)-dependent dehydrogenase (short-subunit alcohol dehydrogenase family)
LTDAPPKTVLITGATNGIGFETAIALARLGARVILVGRDAGRTAEAVRAVQTRSGSSSVDSELCDFSSLEQVRQLAERVRARYPRLDVLVNNAGGAFLTRSLTPDGLESTFAVNHLAPYLLTRLLLDRLITSAPARIITVSSDGHRPGTMDFEDLGFERGYSTMGAYCRSKLGNVLFTRELARRLAGSGVTANCLHPGQVATGIWNSAFPGWMGPLLGLAKKLVMTTPEQAAQRLVYLAMSPEVADRTGLYFDKSRPKEPSRLARDDALARKLWDESARLVGLDGAGHQAPISM